MRPQTLGIWSTVGEVRIFRYLGAKFLRVTNETLSELEKRIAPRSNSFDYPPVFIIGAPRSGSTLLYQILVNTFKFGYLTNLHCRFYGAPYLLQTSFGRWLPESAAPYSSSFGRSVGLMSPSECGQFWYRWFRHYPQFVPMEDTSIESLRSLRHVLVGLTSTFGLPMLFKNMLCALRLEPLSALLPEARFVFIRRNPLWTAQSLLLARQQLHGDKGIWWSMEPPDIEFLRTLPPEEQVVRQIDSIHRLIRIAAQAIGEEHFLEIRYEDLCQDTRGTMERTRAFLLRDGVELKPRFQTPSTLPIAQGARLPVEELAKLRDLIEEIRPYGYGI